LADSPNPSQETVVSSDYELLGKAKQRGAKTQTVEEFISKLVKKKQKKKVVSEKEFQESSSEIKRLLKIFEDKLSKE
ncbi:MAG TPA: hypothetical protein VFU89_01970, partial [Rhabdochlamydiaceae bacterium]|nr:hypothetical protein [Rhabdochlamydiaceae bacterium]